VATFVQSQVSHTTDDTENATGRELIDPERATRRMPSGEKRRRTIRNTAIVGMPIVSTHSRPEVQTEAEAPSGQQREAAVGVDREERHDEGHEPTRRRARARAP
jgi:hypothetical protein